eukprot:2288374-Prymnesium_polylepis.1
MCCARLKVCARHDTARRPTDDREEIGRTALRLRWVAPQSGLAPVDEHVVSLAGVLRDGAT